MKKTQIFILFFLAFTSVSPFTEKEILLQFKGNVTSDPYNSLSSWDISKDPCKDFSGVFCNVEGYVVKIVLWNTSLGGVLSPALSGLSNLRILTLFGNKFTGNLPSEYGEIKSLWKINVSSNALSGSIPKYIGDLYNIRFLDLSNNGYVGEIPSSLFNNCSNTRYVSLSHNSLSGSIPLNVDNCLNLEGIDLSFNNLSGGFLSEFCNIPSLTYLSLRNNMLTGEVKDLVSSCQSLNLLDLGTNLFTGSAPFEVLSFSNLSYFNISNNGFEGEISNIDVCSESLEFLDVSMNRLYGEIPLGITNCVGLKYLDLGFNSVNGIIPIELRNLSNLGVIRLGNNSIVGEIPVEIGEIDYLEVLNLHNLKLVGTIPQDISNCRFLLELDLSGNALQGEIPQNLYNMSYLEILNLHQNQLNGSIPSSLGNISKIRVFDLSRNSLSGSIPESIGNLKNVTNFNLSHNDLSGPIPSSIQHFGFYSFFDNLKLCGPPLTTNCAGNGTTAPSKKPKFSVSAIVAIIAASMILVGVCIITIINMKVRKRKREDETMVIESTPLASSDSNVIIGKLVLFSKTLPSKYEDWEAGTRALIDKECLVGGGSIGTVYKANFEGGISIAVKKLETLGRIRNQEEFEQDIGRLGNLQHPNLVAFQGYYWSSSMQLVLSEFISNGNLYDNLHGLDYPGTSTGVGNIELNWSRRFQIGLGTARALAYLHHDCQPPILHLNIKSQNILLDKNYNPEVSDYGLWKLLPLLDSYGLPKIHTAVGYVAPELAQSLRLSDKCDVYSFGVILLELVTGRKPVESFGENDVVVLCEYVRRMIESGSASDCFDRNLRRFIESEVIQVMKLGLTCTAESPSRRPSMAEIVQILESIQTENSEF